MITGWVGKADKTVMFGLYNYHKADVNHTLNGLSGRFSQS